MRAVFSRRHAWHEACNVLGVATTNINRLRTVGPRKARNVTFKGCWGPEADKHQDGCSESNPMCRYRRPAPCNCPALPFPHRAGSGRCGKGAAHLYKAPEPTPIGGLTPSGWKMSRGRWWWARVAIASMLEGALVEEGPVVLTAEMVRYAADLLSGEVSAPRAQHNIPPGNTGRVRAWWVARRAVAELVIACLDEHEGTVLPYETAIVARELMAGARKPPVLPNARTLAVTRAKPFTVTKPTVLESPAPF